MRSSWRRSGDRRRRQRRPATSSAHVATVNTSTAWRRCPSRGSRAGRPPDNEARGRHPQNACRTSSDGLTDGGPGSAKREPVSAGHGLSPASDPDPAGQQG